jgi:hypothetical protein
LPAGPLSAPVVRAKIPFHESVTRRGIKIMQKDEVMAAVAPCGIPCGDCELFKAKDDPRLMDYLVARGLKREVLPCAGCRPVKGNCPVIEGVCETYACIEKRGYDFCHECLDFPCDKLNPASDRADILPHNLKVFNLCFIQRHGLEGFLKKAPDIKRRYYRGKMVIGRGPQLK